MSPADELYAQTIKEDSTYFLLTGSYTEGPYDGEGISVYAYDLQDGKMTLLSTQDTRNPSFLAASADGQYVYSVNELHKDDEGAVSSFRFHKEDGTLAFINQQPSGGGDPCYLSLSHDGSLLFVANYSGGSLSVIPVLENGGLGESLQTIRHEGSSVDKSRQEAPHVHGVYMHPSKDLLYVTDLGTDQVVIYPINTDSEEPLDVSAKMVYKTTPGSGPRHIIISEEMNRAYLVKEMAGKLEVLEVAEDGNLTAMTEYDLYDGTFSGKNQGAEVKITPDGKYIYVTNRGDADTISAFAILEDGTLSPVSLVKSGGDTPRNFVISPNGKYVVVAHQDSHDIYCFHRDTESGSLGTANKLIETGAPVHFIWIKK